MHLCPARNRKSWDIVGEVIAEATELPSCRALAGRQFPIQALFVTYVMGCGGWIAVTIARHFRLNEQGAGLCQMEAESDATRSIKRNGSGMPGIVRSDSCGDLASKRRSASVAISLAVGRFAISANWASDIRSLRHFPSSTALFPQ